MVKKNKQVDGRTRNWTFILYPESAPSDWRNRLVETRIEAVISPLHDKDINETGEIKKAHYHVLLLYPTVKSYKQVKELTNEFNAPAPQKARSTKGVVRYMLHEDNPEKYQYEKSELDAINGADIATLLKPTASDRYALIGEMMEFVSENDIVELKELIDYSLQERFEDWFPLLCDNSAYIVGEYIKSNRHRARKRELRKAEKTEE